jgi:chorismate synthase
MIRYLTAGESHGQALVGIVEGVPAGLELRAQEINRELKRRQQGYGRGGRMRIESDTVEILSGVRFGRTLGSPITLLIKNRDWSNWTSRMSVEESPLPDDAVTIPRPGHADLVGMQKYRFSDIRNVIERASARETAIRVACSVVTKIFLDQFGISIGSHVVRIGSVKIHDDEVMYKKIFREIQKKHDATVLSDRADASEVRMIDRSTEPKAISLIKRAKKMGETLGGIFDVYVYGLPIGLGSYVEYDRKLDGQLAAALMSVHAVKGVEIGRAFENTSKFGSAVHDEIFIDAKGKIFRKTNHAGGLEGGVTNGEIIYLRAAMKPIATLANPLKSIDIQSLKGVRARYERSDVCAVPACSVIGEAVVAPVLANAFLEKFGGDSIPEIKERYAGFPKKSAKIR